MQHPPNTDRPLRKTKKLRAGDNVPTNTLETIDRRMIVFGETTGIVHLQFRRFAGCPICSLHLKEFVRRRREILGAGIREVIVFHSSASNLRKYAGAMGLELVADPEKRDYRAFGVEASPRALLDPRVWPSIITSVATGLYGVLFRGDPMPPIRPSGGSTGLPADFLIGSDGTLLAVHYGVHADDQWSVEEMLSLARRNAEDAAQPYQTLRHSV